MYCREKDLTEILNKLWTFTAVQERMIRHESLVTRQDAHVPSLQQQCRDAAMLNLISNSPQETLVKPLLDRLMLQMKAMNYRIIPIKGLLETSFSGHALL